MTRFRIWLSTWLRSPFCRHMGQLRLRCPRRPREHAK
jgi:hypothetical protein